MSGDTGLNAKATPHLEFAPPAQPGAGRAWVVAGVAHALLFLALGLATAWKTQPQTVQAEAELWSATPQAAAPKLQEPPPEPDPEPQPTPKPEPVKPTPPQPDPALERRDAQIALEKQKQLDKKKEAEKAEKLKAEREKAAQEKAKAEKEKAEIRRKELEKEKLAKEKKAQEEKERDKKKAAEKAKADKADAARADALRQENLKRMQGMAGASGSENATGTALKSSGPSASYAGRLVGRIKPNITYPGDVVGNPRAEVEVKVSPDGTILSRRIVQTSGNKAWDDAVLRAIDKTEVFPKDSDGRVPPVIVLGFRPLD
ncbi:cell envelope integrity protein TolA [Limnohabitans sp.]|uniref:cell envelope integrity protein TolA n=1 Tax=Limnohabitans sp. TaxID=1907725 RepID=UPI0025BA16BF|nr:cell envelope integrity protein TolA [Limnohabitans sp.]